MGNRKEHPVRKQIKKVGIVGCGTTGSQYVQACAQAGYQVVVFDVNKQALSVGLESIKKRLSQAVTAGQITKSQKKNTLARISGSTEFRNFGSCDFIVEAVPEKMELKKAIFEKLDGVCAPDVILATNTSVLSILEISKATRRPDRVVGVHGAPLVFPAIEVITTLLTSAETVQTAMNFATSMGRYAFLVKDAPGFLMNRLLTPFFLDMVRLVETGYVTAEEIDLAFTKGMGWPVGPMRMLDEAGLDTMVFAADAMYEALKDSRFVVPVMLRNMITAGWLGVKTGKGFYDHP